VSIRRTKFRVRKERRRGHGGEPHVTLLGVVDQDPSKPRVLNVCTVPGFPQLLDCVFDRDMATSPATLVMATDGDSPTVATRINARRWRFTFINDPQPIGMAWNAGGFDFSGWHAVDALGIELQECHGFVIQG
jgi:hypothetical protein